MTHLLLLGATGNLGRVVLQQALEAGHQVTVVVRSPDKLPAALRPRLQVRQADLDRAPPAELAALLAGPQAVINTAGRVGDGAGFVRLVDRIATALEAQPEGARPVAWFLGGAALLDLDARGRRGLDLPRVAATYGPHRENFERLRRGPLDWRMLCPGPMVEGPALGLPRLRTSIDRVPVTMPALAEHLPGPLLLPVFGYKVPEMIVPYADAAALMLAHLSPGGPMSRHRVGLALPEGQRGHKREWTAKAG